MYKGVLVMVSKRRARFIALLALMLLVFVPSRVGAQSAQGQYPPNATYSNNKSAITATPSSYSYLFAAGGPCVGMSSCVVYINTTIPHSGYLVRTVFYNGRYWNFDMNTNPPRVLTTWGSGSTVTSVARWKNYPCAGLNDQACMMTLVLGRSFYTNASGYIREQIRVEGTKLSSYTMYYFDPYTGGLLQMDYFDPLGGGGAGGGRPRP